MHWEAFRYICQHYPVRGSVITPITPQDLPSVHQQLGWESADSAKAIGVDVYYMPEGDRASQVHWLQQTLKQIQPDFIWVQEEPVDYFLFQILRFYYFQKTPQIITAVCENIFRPLSLLSRWKCHLLWLRLNGLIAVATTSIEGIYQIGFPRYIPTYSLVAGALLPPLDIQPFPLPLTPSPTDFLVGFVGRICEEKGWKVLLSALRHLPQYFKCLLAGDGSQLEQLIEWMADPELQGRVFYVGLLPKAKLWQFYHSLHCLVVPSLTTATWKEQFGGVLADAMAVGLPIIGSDSGAIPEVVGNAGLITPEGDVTALTKALQQLQQDFSQQSTLYQTLVDDGKRRFQQEFAIPAYAEKIATALKLSKH